MKTSNWMKNFAAVAGSALVGLIFATGANAANPEPVPVRVEWIAPAAIAENAVMNFGLLDVAAAGGVTVTINTDDSFSESTANTVVGGIQAAAQVTITVADTTPITILVDSIGAGAHYTLSAFMCSYQSAAAVACSASAYDVTSTATSSTTGDIVEIGATLLTAGGASAVTDDTTFDVTVTYQ